MTSPEGFVQRRKLEPATMLGVWFAVALHTVWVITLLIGSPPKNVTGVHSLAELFPNRYGLAIILAVVAACATGGIFHRAGLAKILLLTPQQLVLGLSAAGAVNAMIVGHFADGVARPQLFLVADQTPVVLALLVHSATILYLALLPDRR